MVGSLIKQGIRQAAKTKPKAKPKAKPESVEKLNKTVEGMINQMTKKERDAFFKSMGYATPDAEGVKRSYRKKGGTVKLKKGGKPRGVGCATKGYK